MCTLTYSLLAAGTAAVCGGRWEEFSWLKGVLNRQCCKTVLKAKQGLLETCVKITSCPTDDKHDTDQYFSLRLHVKIQNNEGPGQDAIICCFVSLVEMIIYLHVNWWWQELDFQLWKMRCSRQEHWAKLAWCLRNPTSHASLHLIKPVWGLCMAV